jgi:hypothetical protein
VTRRSDEFLQGYLRAHSKGAVALDEYQADDVGGIWKVVPRTETLVGRAIAQTLSRPFGVGNAYYRLARSASVQWVDTLPFFCVRRELFERIGLFNENLARSQDMEFKCRLKKAGGKILLVPDIVSCYYAGSGLRSFWKHNFQIGVWAILPFAYSNVVPVSPRHLVPLGFVAALLGTSLLGLLWRLGCWLLLAIPLPYGLSNLAASLHVAWRERSPRFLLSMPWVFALLHVAYGSGSLYGVVKLIRTPGFWAKISGSKNTRRENQAR